MKTYLSHRVLQRLFFLQEREFERSQRATFLTMASSAELRYVRNGPHSDLFTLPFTYRTLASYNYDIYFLYFFFNLTVWCSSRLFFAAILIIMNGLFRTEKKGRRKGDERKEIRLEREREREV